MLANVFFSYKSCRYPSLTWVWLKSHTTLFFLLAVLLKRVKVPKESSTNEVIQLLL